MGADKRLMERRRLTKVQRRWRIVTPLCAAFLLLAGASGASAQVFTPPPGKIFTGVTDKPVSAYTGAVGKHPAVYQEFVAWGQWLPGITNDAVAAHARMMMAITTASGSREAITPAAIADGQGDAWLIGLNRAVFESHNITYVRLMGEMDGYWNPYCAYNADGSSRGSAHSPRAYRQAWRRATLILRGGPVRVIDRELHRLGMPPLRASGSLPRPEVAMMWVPEVAPGDPDVPGNQPGDYWPGSAWVDWIGTDFYSNAPNFRGLARFYDDFRGKPFVFAEYALWDSGDDVGFIDRLFDAIAARPRVRMLVYNQGASADGPFRLWRYPNAARAIRAHLAESKFLGYAPEWTPR